MLSVSASRFAEGGLPVGIEGEDLVEIGDPEDAMQLGIQGADSHLPAVPLRIARASSNNPNTCEEKNLTPEKSKMISCGGFA